MSSSSDLISVIKAWMFPGSVLICLIAVTWVYFVNNPMRHSRPFMIRRFVNWLPLGMTYAFLTMGRYNLNVAKNALGSLMSNEDFGWIVAAGTIVYGCSFLVNGPIVDKIGGKKGILISAVGAAGANILLGILTWLSVTHQIKINLVFAFAALYALNMYFQSYGAVSIIKVKAYWFHVRERGVFGAIFGTFISAGAYFAFDWSQAIVDATKAVPGTQPGWLGRLLHNVFAMGANPVDATWAVFFVPAAIMLFWVAVDAWLIKDTPEEANFPHMDPADASSGQMHIELSRMDLLKKVFASRLMLMIAAIAFSMGVLRNGIMQWYLVFASQMKQPESQPFTSHWGWLLCIFGIVGGLAGGLVSDKYFRSRRGPPVAILFCFMFVMTVFISVFLFSSPFIVGSACVFLFMAATGIHSLMAGTAAADFGGRKATATCSGIVDGFVYLGGGLQSACLGQLTTLSWHWWPIFLMPFSIIGAIIGIMIWNELPAATRKYINEVENPAAVRQEPQPAAMS